MMPTSESFELSFRFFQENRESLLKQYKGKIIAIYIDKVLGTYESKTSALLSVPDQFQIKAGSFIIKDCSEDSSKSVRVYQSNVSFSK
jgi:hypothetical protein